MFPSAALTRRHFERRGTKSQSQIHLSRGQLATGRIEFARQIAGRVNKAKGGEKAKRDESRAHPREEESIQRGGGGGSMRVEAEGGSEIGEERERVGTFHSLSQQRRPPGGFANRNRRPWSVYEFPQLATRDKQIASYFCIQRLNGRRVWNDAPARYKRPLLANTGGERHARRIPNVIFARPSSSSSSLSHSLFLSGSSAPRRNAIAKLS